MVGQWQLLRTYLNSFLYFDGKKLTPKLIEIAFEESKIKEITSSADKYGLNIVDINEIIKDIGFEASKKDGVFIIKYGNKS